MGMNEYEARVGRDERRPARRLLLWIAPLCILACTLIACATTPATARADTPTVAASPDTPSAPPSASPTPATSLVPTVPAPSSGLVVTVLATDVALWQAPDTQSGHVAVSFTINGNAIQTMDYVSGEVPVLEADIAGTDGRRWTRVLYSGHAGPLDDGTSFTVTGYLRNDLISAPHAPGAPPVPNP